MVLSEAHCLSILHDSCAKMLSTLIGGNSWVDSIRRASCYGLCIDTEEVAQWVECLPGMHKVVGSLPSIALLGVVADTCNLSLREVETGGSEVRSHQLPVGVHETSETDGARGRGEGGKEGGEGAKTSPYLKGGMGIPLF